MDATLPVVIRRTLTWLGVGACSVRIHKAKFSSSKPTMSTAAASTVRNGLTTADSGDSGAPSVSSIEHYHGTINNSIVGGYHYYTIYHGTSTSADGLMIPDIFYEEIKSLLPYILDVLQNSDSRVRVSLVDMLRNLVDQHNPPAAEESQATQPDFVTLAQLTHIALCDPDGPGYPRLSLMLSVAESFEMIIKELGILCRKYVGLNASDCNLRILSLVTRIAEDFWLTDSHRRLIFQAFCPAGDNSPEVIFTSTLLSRVLPVHEDEYLQILHVLLHEKRASRVVAESFAILEQEIRLHDPHGERVRWLARDHPRDLLSFPERVENLVLHSLLMVDPCDMKLYAERFYRVAKHSKRIQDYSAMFAILSALLSLPRFRWETGFTGRQLEKFKLSSFSYKQRLQKPKFARKPFLYPLSDMICKDPQNTSYSIQVVDTQHIQWSMLDDLESVTKSKAQAKYPFLSAQLYSFERSGMLAGLKHALTNVQLVNAQSQDFLAAQRYRDAHRPGKIFK